MQKPSEKQGVVKIRGDVLRNAREFIGLDREELAELVCLKSWHITQMEDSEEHFYFYSAQLKINAAKRIGKYLELEESSYLY